MNLRQDAKEILKSISQFCFLANKLEGFRSSSKVEFICSKITESIEKNECLVFNSEKDSKILEEIRKKDEVIKKEIDNQLKSKLI